MLAVSYLLIAAVCAHTGASAGPGPWMPWLSPGWREPLAREVVQPKRLLHQLHSEEEMLHSRLDTRVRNSPGGAQTIHLTQSSFFVKAFGSSFILDLELNHNLLSTDYVERHFEKDGQLSQNMGGEHCYYHGNVRGIPESWVALSTCNGLHGMFSDGNFSYGIEPVGSTETEQQTDHTVYRMPNIDPLPPSCPGCSLNNTERETGGDLQADNQLKEGVDLSEQARPVYRRLRRSKRQVRRGQRTVQTETKYIELMIVNDYEMFVKFRRSISQTKVFAKSVVNMADLIYKEQLNTRIVLVAMETWSSENQVSVGHDPLLTLRDFMKYRKESIKEHSDAVHLFSGKTFHNRRGEAAYIGGICSVTRGGGVIEFNSMGSMAITLCQSLGQNIGMLLKSKDQSSAGDCRCPDLWLGCIMEDTGFNLPRKFSRCSIDQYLRFLQQGGGSCLFNKPTKLLDPSECGNGFVELGEECDCGSLVDCTQSGANCCKKCTLTHNAMCSNGLCCRDCKYELRGVRCRDAVNDCDIPEICTGDSSQCPHNVHKLDGYSCDVGQGRCYGGRCKTRDSQCRTLWGYNSADRFCYEKLNSEGTEKGNCGMEPSGQGWLPCNKQDVLCGLLLCTNLTARPLYGELQGKLTSLTVHHQNRYLDCRGGHAVLDDGLDLGYVEDGTPCGPNMMCSERRCLPITTFNSSSCPGSLTSRICSHHGTCSNEVKCICDEDFTGKDCSVFDPIVTPTPNAENKKGPSGTNIIIGSVAGAILVAAIILGGTGWGFKNIRKGRSSGV